MSQMIIAAFPTHAEADTAVSQLEQAGYTPQDISVVSRAESMVHPDGMVAAGMPADTPADGAAEGAAAGGAIGGLAGLLAGAGAIPALAGLLFGGPIAAALGATGVLATTISGAVTGAVVGGLIGALTKLGVPEETARYYDETVSKGGILLAVPVREGDTIDAQRILSAHDAQKITTVTTP